MKKERQQALISYIRAHAVSTQEELQQALTDQGFQVTQATISRDMKDLRIMKAVNEEGLSCYLYHEPKPVSDLQKKYNDIFVSGAISVDHAMNDVVIKCHAGMASAACAALDEMKNENIVGTLAGDDTIFVILRSPGDAVILTEKLNEMLHKG